MDASPVIKFESMDLNIPEQKKDDKVWSFKPLSIPSISESKKETHGVETDIVVDNINKNIRLNWDIQPQSIKDIYLKAEGVISEIFVKSEKIDDREFIFSSVYQEPGSGYDTVMALTKDEYDPNKYATRVFYKSRSDRQWRSVPSTRFDGSFMKGQEDNPLHHYVQSSKLDKRIHDVLDNLPDAVDGYSFNPLEYLPRGHNKYAEENNFTERYKSLKNLEWARYQKHCQNIYSIYKHFTMTASRPKDYTKDGELYKWLIGKEENDNLRVLKQAIEDASEDPETYRIIKKAAIFDLKYDFNPNVVKLAQVYDKEVSALIEYLFSIKAPESIIPEFSEENCIDKYEREDYEGNIVQIEEYKVNSPDGDELVFSMAYDKKGNIYIDNIYDPRDNVTSYGTMGEIVQMGHLVYKSEDYASQTNIGFPKNFIGEKNGKYVNINKLWKGNVDIIDRFNTELERRKNKNTLGTRRFRGRYS